MRKLSAYIFVMFGVINTSMADVIHFDDIDANLGDVSLDGSPYQQLNWDNFYAYTSIPGFDGFNQGIVSGSNAAYSGGETAGSSVEPIIGSVTSSTLFNLESLYLGAGYYDDLQVTIEGKRAGSTIASATFTVNTQGAVFHTLNFLSLDEVSLYAHTTSATSDPFFCGTVNCTQFTLDDVAITLLPGTPAPPPIPTPPPSPPPAAISEPSFMALLGVSLCSLVLTGYRRRYLSS